MTPDSWIVMPVIDCLDYTIAAVEDCLEQHNLPSPPRILIIDNGSTRETRRALEMLSGGSVGRILYWPHNPPLGGPPFGTLSASWNAGLDFCWKCGAQEALVVNNDIEMHPRTYSWLRAAMFLRGAQFVSAVGVTKEDFEKADFGFEVPGGSGGPDFSCFLISKACHERFPFDPQFTYYNDNDLHHRMIRAGEGDRIFSVNVPYLHHGSRTINRSPEIAAAYKPIFELHQKRYVEKWGGLPREETFATPYNR